MDKKIQQAENKGRKKAKQQLDNCPTVINYVFTDDQYDHIDLYVTGKNYTMAVEIKDRTNMPQHKKEMADQDGYLIEKLKYDYLMSASTLSGYTPIYITYIKESGKTLSLSWDITKVTPLFIKRKCREKSMSDDDTHIWKLITLLPRNKASIKILSYDQ